jgi:bifunctional DNA-binding transcriptional regulator/antitoxin component of YhaV-PrlF toxin-antitoxin module
MRAMPAKTAIPSRIRREHGVNPGEVLVWETSGPDVWRVRVVCAGGMSEPTRRTEFSAWGRHIAAREAAAADSWPMS